MTKIILQIEELATDETYQPQGHWGVQLAPNEKFAYQCPMFGLGGAVEQHEDGFDALSFILAAYDNQCAGGSEEDGPDEFIFLRDGIAYYVEVTYDPEYTEQ